MDFEHKEDKEFFCQLLCDDGETIGKYMELFDFRDPDIKRKEFDNNKRKLHDELLKHHLKKCMIGYARICDPDANIEIDHIIPLSTNELNKKIRNLQPERGKKVKTQSFGSNDIKNLIFACKKCNAHKKHLFLEIPILRKILNQKFNVS
ncbi:MAG: hypothetical protein GC154_06050 [bacterium]|nr:hypothetical protein [bacterium]